MTISLSICIPTYNRSGYLKECLNSILDSASGYEHEIEIVISDNASADDTTDVVQGIRESYPWITYHRNEKNIGAERNFHLLANMAKAEYIWIFGDDDRMEKQAIPFVIDSVRAGYNLIVCNFSMWNKDFSLKRNFNGLPWEKDQIINTPNELLQTFGINLGYTSSIIIKKALFLGADFKMYERLCSYGFSFLYAVYAGLENETCKAKYISSSVVCNRGSNSSGFDWTKYFVVGVASAFDGLIANGYARSAVFSAKHGVLKNTILRRIIYAKTSEIGDEKNIGIIFKHYKYDWFFWLVCVPIYFTPAPVLLFLKKLFLMIRPSWRTADS